MGELAASPDMWDYFNTLKSRLDEAIVIANAARSRGGDPEPHVEIPLALDLADRVEKLIGVAGVAAHIRKLEETMGREVAALQLGADVAAGVVGTFKTRKEAVDSAVRVAVAMLTEGVVAAPIEGIDRVDISKNDDGTEYIQIFYSGPIRSAGGTAQALSVLVADFVRRSINIDRYKPRPEEIERYLEEIPIYRRVANLQYMPSDAEIRMIVENCPICIDGEPTEEAEVDGHRDLARVGTNRVRGGMCLVIAEGMALKAPKIQRHVSNLKIDGWEWLDDFIAGGKKSDDEDDGKTLKPKDKYLRDLIAGRPVFCHPSRPGGFRLRYGRSRNTSFAAGGISPATMVMVDDFIAPGTQVKVERPGKALGIAPVDSIEGPTVRLVNGDVFRVDTESEALEVRDSVEYILDLGEILINYGDFLENNHPLVPSSYCFEWWVQELEQKANLQDVVDSLYMKGASVDILEKPDAELALAISDTYGVPLHPKYTYLWHDVTISEIRELSKYIAEHGSYSDDVLTIPLNVVDDVDGKEIKGDAQVKEDDIKGDTEGIKYILEELLVWHIVRGGNILIRDSMPLLRCLGLNKHLGAIAATKRGVTTDSITNDGGGDGDRKPVELVSALSGITIRERAPVRIGARMGRPEKSKKREMKPAVHMLFPIGDSGGKQRLISEVLAYSKSMHSPIGTINVEIGVRQCTQCKGMGFGVLCECGGRTVPYMRCPKCNIDVQMEACPKCSYPTISYKHTDVDMRSHYRKALDKLDEREGYPIKAVQGLISKHKIAEPMEKGILRAKHGVYVFKDGTIRYDLSDLPLTHFIPKEIGLSVEKALELGYHTDIYGSPLLRPDQILQLKVQDLVVSDDAGKYLLQVSHFIDDLLVRYYGVKPYYNAQTPSDLVGALLIGLAPHTSAGVLGRFLGMTRASVGYAHPFFHAAKRRNCDGDEDCVMLLLDGLLNFSMHFLPDRRGGKMDAPLVMTTRLDPSEVDKEAHNIDVNERYPLEFYEATVEFEKPKVLEKRMDLVSGRLSTPQQYDGFMFTHHTSDIAAGPLNSAYKTLGSMIEKMDAQLLLGQKIRAVDASDVAERVINSHFMPDLIGNLRAFSRQKTRCLKCGTSFRRPPLSGLCPKCRGKVILTVHEGSVKKYLEVATKVGKEYGISDYAQQRLELLNLEIGSLFKSDVVKQADLSDFM